MTTSNRDRTVTRSCVGCGAKKSKTEMFHVVRQGDEARADFFFDKPGRGASICRSKDCILLGQKRRGLERTLRISNCAGAYEDLLQKIEEKDES